MFFIGIFGIQNKQKHIKTENSIICPICEAYGRYDIIKTYNCFHIFFIPIWQWNKRYYVQTHCCNRTCELHQEIGIKLEKGESLTIEKEQIHCDDQHITDICPYCSAHLEPSFNYCPNCGNQIH
ncbi:MAG: zinc ribbon domain-containing protein [Firmicutes bacterium]|nr:zinc ribbon domain-containing protein [Bacillota bacterium]